MRHAKVALLVMTMLLSASTVSAWTLKLDIDTDLDPTTLNLSTDDTTAELALHLWPDISGEPISQIIFGLGVSCSQCGAPEDVILLAEAGLLYTGQDWMDHPAFQTTWHDVATCIDCCDETIGLNLADMFGATADPPFAPEVPVTLVRFSASALGGPGPWCPAMHKRVAVWAGDERHEVILDADGVIPSEQTTWSSLKSLYH